MLSTIVYPNNFVPYSVRWGCILDSLLSVPSLLYADDLNLFSSLASSIDCVLAVELRRVSKGYSMYYFLKSSPTLLFYILGGYPLPCKSSFQEPFVTFNDKLQYVRHCWSGQLRFQNFPSLVLRRDLVHYPKLWLSYPWKSSMQFPPISLLYEVVLSYGLLYPLLVTLIYNYPKAWSKCVLPFKFLLGCGLLHLHWHSLLYTSYITRNRIGLKICEYILLISFATKGFTLVPDLFCALYASYTKYTKLFTKFH